MSKKSELRATVKLIKSHLKNLGKATLTQEEVYEYLDSIKVEVPDDDMDIMLRITFRRKHSCRWLWRWWCFFC
nr:hypothetical protein [Mycoplasmopsis bovis]